MRLAPNDPGFSPQNTHRPPQLASTFRANTCCPTLAAASRMRSVCCSVQVPSAAALAIWSLKAFSRAEGPSRQPDNGVRPTGDSPDRLPDERFKEGTGSRLSRHSSDYLALG